MFSCDKYLKYIIFVLRLYSIQVCQGSALSTNSNWQTLFELDILGCMCIA